MKVVVKADAEQRAQFEALDVMPDRVTDSSTPAEVQSLYTKALRERTESNDEAAADAPPLKRLREVIAKCEGRAGDGDGAGPSVAEEDELGEDGFAMTQETVSFKCPLYQVEMTEQGDYRPMRGSCGHVFSWKGVTEAFKRSKNGMPCPMSGCSATLTLKALVEAKDVAKQIKRARRDS